MRRLKPLLDGFMRHDKHRTGTVPADVFRQALVEEHGGVWPELGKRGGVHVNGHGHGQNTSVNGLREIGGTLVHRGGDGGERGGARASGANVLARTTPRYKQVEMEPHGVMYSCISITISGKLSHYR